MAADKKKSPNNWTIYSGDNKRILLEKDGIESSNTFYDGYGKVLDVNMLGRKSNEDKRD
jgi:hypothetical protein